MRAIDVPSDSVIATVEAGRTAGTAQCSRPLQCQPRAPARTALCRPARTVAGILASVLALALALALALWPTLCCCCCCYSPSHSHSSRPPDAPLFFHFTLSLAFPISIHFGCFLFLPFLPLLFLYIFIYTRFTLLLYASGYESSVAH